MSGFLLVLGWEVALGLIGFTAPPEATFGGLIIEARQCITVAPWLIQYISGLFLPAALLGTTFLYALVSIYRFPRRHTFLRG